MAEYIEREAALMKLMQDGCNAKNLQSISDIPAADVSQVVHGRRIKGSSNPYCSECFVECRDETPFCPNCGAKMGGGNS